MKTNKVLQRLRTSLALSIVLLTLTACTPLSPSDPASPADTAAPPAETDTSPDALRTYYESLISDLQQELLEEKQADYIIRTEYESRTATLEAEATALEAKIADLEAELSALRDTVGSDIPVSGAPADSGASGEAADPPTSMAFHYGITEGVAVIYAYLGNETDVTIPTAIEGYPVARIADNAFQGTAVTSVVIPVSVTAIGWFAFADCPSLRTVTIPASVTAIEYGAFDGCPDLTVYCPSGSYAAEYALSFGMRHTYT